MIRNKELENLLFNYIKDHEDDHVDMVDLVIAFPKYGQDRILHSLSHLRMDKKISKSYIGNWYKYTLKEQ